MTVEQINYKYSKYNQYYVIGFNLCNKETKPKLVKTVYGSYEAVRLCNELNKRDKGQFIYTDVRKFGATAEMIGELKEIYTKNF